MMRDNSILTPSEAVGPGSAGIYRHARSSGELCDAVDERGPAALVIP